MNPVDFQPIQETRAAAYQAATRQTRRVIGPIPPRDDKGRLRLAPIMEKRVKLNPIGEPVRDENGNAVEEMTDTRDPREYATFEHGQQVAEGATKGLRLFQVDLAPEPLVQVYARNADDALKVFKAEMGITRFGERDPKVSELSR